MFTVAGKMYRHGKAPLVSTYAHNCRANKALEPKSDKVLGMRVRTLKSKLPVLVIAKYEAKCT